MKRLCGLVIALVIADQVAKRIATNRKRKFLSSKMYDTWLEEPPIEMFMPRWRNW